MALPKLINPESVRQDLRGPTHGLNERSLLIVHDAQGIIF